MEQSSFRKYFKLAIAAIVVVAVIWLGWSIYYATTFHVINTEPSSNNVSTQTPFFKLSFSRAVSSSKLSYTSNPSIIASSNVNNKVLTLNLHYPLNANTKYTITIMSIYDTGGSKLTNISLTFTPKYTAYNKLPANQQAVILKQQQVAANNQPPNFSGTSSLISQGLSTQQVQIFQQAITSFAKSTNLDLKSAVIDEASVTTGPINPDGTFSVTFSLFVNSTSYEAKFQYVGLTDGELFLYNPQSGSQIFDSGVINLSSSGT